ncbi:unnamed protein product [Camellia sinensis]
MPGWRRELARCLKSRQNFCNLVFRVATMASSTRRCGGKAMVAFVVLCLALASSCEAGRLGGPRTRAARVGEKFFNVMQFGAKPNGVQDCTQAFMQAWVAACGVNGYARVVVPKGIFKVTELIFSGPCKNPSASPLIFQIFGTIKADSDLSNYPDKGWISFNRVNGLMITGDGIIDGQGQNVWKYNDCKSNPDCAHLAASLYINNVQNGKIRGLHLVNSMGFHMHITNCNNIRAQALTLTAPADSPNTDGIHISRSQMVKVSRSTIGTGDDCISIGQGATDVTLNRIKCGPGHGISVGSLGKLPQEMDVRGLIVKNCSLTDTTNGIRIKTWPGSDPSKASGMLFTNIVMKNVKNPIIIDQGYGGKSSAKPSRVKISDIIYQNIGGTTQSEVGVNLMCSTLAPCENLRFQNINLRFNGPNNVRPTSTCTNARVGYSGIQIPPPCK